MANATSWKERAGPRSEQNPSLRTGTGERPTSSANDPMARLLRTIEGEIIPRLLLAHQSSPGTAAGEPAIFGRAQPDDVVEFARLIMAHDLHVATAYVEALLARGLSLEQVYLELLAPAARLLGEWWKEDLRDFTEVTSGLCRMRQLLHGFSPAFVHEGEVPARGQRVLLVPLPGEQHTFGLIMVCEFFRRAGWDVWDMYPSSSEELQALAHSQWFSLIGVSLSCEARLEQLGPVIHAARAASRNPAVSVMVGGLPFNGRADLVAAVGADGSASDGRRAAIEATKLLGSRENRV